MDDKFLFVALWCIWKSRNVIIFENKSVSVEDTIQMMKTLFELWSVGKDL